MNKDFFYGAFAGILLFSFLAFLFIPAYSISVVSSPGAEGEILSLIDSAQESVYVEVYILTSGKVVDSLISAHMRGVDVKVILEGRVSGNANALSYSRLSGAGVGVCWGTEEFKLTHSKIIVVDGRKALVGSHNFSNSALNYNREISVLIEGNAVGSILSIFTEDWEACSL